MKRPSRSHSVESKEDGALVSNRVALATVWSAWRGPVGPQRERLDKYAFYIALCAALFIRPLAGLMRHAAEFQLHSHIPLIPFVVGYLLYLGRGAEAPVYRTSPAGAMVFGVIASGALAAALWWREALSTNDYLAQMTLSFVSALAAGGFLFLGTDWMRRAAFPFSFLVFMIPMPDGMTRALELASVSASADVSAALFKITGTPILRDGNVFALPGIVIEVAQECSGVRSSWVLFITGLLGSHLLLTSSWRRIVLVALVFPLAIVRNGFRILVIGLLCVHVGPHMIDSPIHHQGGPLFFALSLIPFFLLVWWLRRTER
jgi:exosortase C (VPDSG-CTERM-specific)